MCGCVDATPKLTSHIGKRKNKLIYGGKDEKYIV